MSKEQGFPELRLIKRPAPLFGSRSFRIKEQKIKSKEQGFSEPRYRIKEQR